MTDYWNQSSVSVGYGNDEIVNHLGFCPRGCELSLFGNALWRAGYYTDPNETFLRYDPDPLERLGFLVFPRIGVTTTGFHDNDENQRALTVFPAGTWDEWLKTASKPDLSKYGKKGA